jgi:tetratricopeptide (TPR) repeat protein
MATPYAPFRSLLGRVFEREDGDGSEGRTDGYEPIRARVGEIVAERADEVAPFLATMLGVPVPEAASGPLRFLEPQELREQAFRSVGDLFVALAGAAMPGGLVLVFEDLHWADTTSLDLLESLLPLVDSEPILILALFRPQRDEPSWRFHEVAAREFGHRYTALALEPLDEAGTRALVGNLLSRERLPEELRGLILEKAEGNPFYVEEVIRGLLEAGVIVREDGAWRATRAIGQIEVPDSLAGVIAARLDRLEREAKQVAQGASVIGRAFAFPILAEVQGSGPTLDRALTDLQRRELVREVRRIPDRLFMFKHALTQETVYASVLLSRRRTLHRRVAECIERLYGEALEAHLAALSYHYFEAGVWEKALEYGRRMGEKAQTIYAPRDAIDHFSRALEAARHLGGEAPTDLLRARGQAYETVGDPEAAAADYRASLEGGRAAGDRRAEWQALLDLGLFSLGWEFAKAGDYFREALGLARRLDDRSLVARSLNRFGNWLVNVDRATEGLRHHEEALAIFREMNDRRGMADTYDLLALASAFATGDAAAAAAYYDEAAALYEELDDRQALVSTLANIAQFGGFYLQPTMLAGGRSLADAVGSGERALTLARAIGWQSGEAYAAGTVAEGRAAQGELGRALELSRGALAIAEGIRHQQWSTMGHMSLAGIHLALLALPEARRHAEIAVAMSDQNVAPMLRQIAAMTLVWVRIAQGDIEDAEALLRADFAEGVPPGAWAGWFASIQAALALARGEPARAVAGLEPIVAPPSAAAGWAASPRLSLILAVALAATGRPAEAEAALAAGEALAREQGARGVLWPIQIALGRLYRGQGRAGEAERAFAAAGAVVAEIAGSIPEAELRETFVREASARIASPRDELFW